MRARFDAILGRVADLASWAAASSREELARQAATSLYHATTAVAMAWEAQRSGDARRLLLADDLVLRHRLSARDPLAREPAPRLFSAGFCPKSLCVATRFRRSADAGACACTILSRLRQQIRRAPRLAARGDRFARKRDHGAACRPTQPQRTGGSGISGRVDLFTYDKRFSHMQKFKVSVSAPARQAYSAYLRRAICPAVNEEAVSELPKRPLT